MSETEPSIVRKSLPLERSSTGVSFTEFLLIVLVVLMTVLCAIQHIDVKRLINSPPREVVIEAVHAPSECECDCNWEVESGQVKIFTVRPDPADEEVQSSECPVQSTRGSHRFQ